MGQTVDPSKRGRILHSNRIYGTAVSGAPLRVFTPPNGRACGLLLAAQHGDEPETAVLLSAALRSVADLRAAAVTAVNPDGLALGTRGNARGVDLNRNCPAANWRPEPVYYPWYNDEEKRVELSPGEAPGSEPETRALLALIEEIDPSWIVSLHARLACIDDPLDTPLARWLA
ncbi:murein tripeptide amidase MpaA, partial [candidate division KSB1 bacterium]|nr:murein tripeptide amidase MpaA [candidate division KSB1 bacterium]